MEYGQIASSGIQASRIGLGTWAIGGTFWGGADESDAIRTIHRALDMGINLIDTAPVYGYGESESIVGTAVRQYGRRDRIVLATKVGLGWKDGSIYRDSSPRRLEQELDDSLRRLKTDCIDIYQVHWPDRSVPFEETASVMSRFMEKGKIRAIGVSNFSPEQMDRFRSAAPLHCVQPPLNLFEREMEADVLPYAQNHDLTVLGYGALCRGLLSGQVGLGTTFEGDDIRQYDPKFQSPRLEQYVEAVRRLDQLARQQFNRRVIHLAVRWVLDRHPHTIALWGARRPGQLDPVPDVMNWEIDDSFMTEVDRILDETIEKPIGAGFMAPPDSLENGEDSEG